MATDLTFINDLAQAYEGWSAGEKIEAALKFYSATGTDTQAVNRFVRTGTRTYANGGHLEFEAVSAQNQDICGVLIPHTHDDPTKEFTDVVAVGKQGRVIQYAIQPVWVEVATDLKTTMSHPNVAIAADTAGYAVVAGTGDTLQGRTAGGGDGVGWRTIGSKFYVAVLLAREKAVVA